MFYLCIVGGHPDQGGIGHIQMVWNLCVALWGNLPQLREPGTDWQTLVDGRIKPRSFTFKEGCYHTYIVV